MYTVQQFPAQQGRIMPQQYQYGSVYGYYPMQTDGMSSMLNMMMPLMIMMMMMGMMMPMMKGFTKS